MSRVITLVGLALGCATAFTPSTHRTAAAGRLQLRGSALVMSDVSSHRVGRRMIVTTGMAAAVFGGAPSAFALCNGNPSQTQEFPECLDSDLAGGGPKNRKKLAGERAALRVAREAEEKAAADAKAAAEAKRAAEKAAADKAAAEKAAAEKAAADKAAADKAAAAEKEVADKAAAKEKEAAAKKKAVADKATAKEKEAKEKKAAKEKEAADKKAAKDSKKAPAKK